VVGHSLKEDFEHLKLNEDEYACEIRDISEISFFMRKNKNHDVVQGSGSRVLLNENNSLSLTDQSSSGGGSSPNMVTPARFNPFANQKRKLKELADEFLNAKIQ